MSRATIRPGRSGAVVAADSHEFQRLADFHRRAERGALVKLSLLAFWPSGLLRPRPVRRARCVPSLYLGAETSPRTRSVPPSAPAGLGAPVADGFCLTGKA